MTLIHGIPTNVVYATLGVYALLILASFVVGSCAGAIRARAMRISRAGRNPGGG
jgi:hypothetical protein